MCACTKLDALFVCISHLPKLDPKDTLLPLNLPISLSCTLVKVRVRVHRCVYYLFLIFVGQCNTHTLHKHKHNTNTRPHLCCLYWFLLTKVHVLISCSEKICHIQQKLSCRSRVIINAMGAHSCWACSIAKQFAPFTNVVCIDSC